MKIRSGQYFGNFYMDATEISNIRRLLRSNVSALYLDLVGFHLICRGNTRKDVSHSYLYFHFWQIYGKLPFVEYASGANKIILTNGAFGSVVPVFKHLELLLENFKRFSESTVY